MFGKKFLHLTILLVGLSCYSAYSQIAVSGGLGFTTYAGDLSAGNPAYTREALNAEIWYSLHRNVQLKTGMSVYKLYSEDEARPEVRNRAFEAKLAEFYTSLMLNYTIGDLMPFAYAGVGLTKVDPEGIQEAKSWNVNLAVHQTDGGKEIPKTALIMPVGFGVRYRVHPQFAVILDAGMRFAQTDQLDGVSVTSFDIDELNSVTAQKYYETLDAQHDEGRVYGGNPEKNDVYGIFTISLQYIMKSYGPNSDYLQYRKAQSKNRSRSKYRRRGGNAFRFKKRGF